jgi:hypothetical protein
MKRLMYFELSNPGLASYVAVAKTFTMVFVPENLL